MDINFSFSLGKRKDAAPLNVRASSPGPDAMPPTRIANQPDALSLSIVYRAVQIISTGVSQMSVDAFRGNDLLDPAPLWIRNPDINSNRRVFLEETTNSLALNGNAYWRIYRDSQGRIQGLEVLNPLDMEVEHTSWGTVTGYQYKGQTYNPSDIKHLKFLRVPGRVKGLGPIQAANPEIAGALDVRDYSSEWFNKAAVPNGVLTSDQYLDAEQAQQWLDQWTSAQTAHKPAVLGNGLSYARVGLSPKDALWIEAQKFNTTSVARLFGVPASLMLAEGGDGSYQNVQQEWVAFIRFTLSKFYGEIEQAFTDLLPRNTEARFNVEALLRADTATRYASHAIAIQTGFMTINEVRAIENLKPLPKSQLDKPAAPATQPAPEEGNTDE